METLCFIRRPTFNDPQTLTITAEEFEGIAEAREKLSRVSLIEEKFIMLTENFIEFESTLHSLVLRYSVYLAVDWFEFQDAIFTVNRRLLNLLAACRLYLDQVNGDVIDVFGRESAPWQAFDAARRKEFDETTGYRMMEGLRNHLQHHNIAVQHLGFPGRRHDTDGQVLFVHTIEPSIRLDDLRHNDHLNAKVRESLKDLPDQVCITPWVREYVDGLSRVHASLHQAMANVVEQWHASLAAMLDRGQAALGDSASGYVAVRIGEDGREVHVFPDLLKTPQSAAPPHATPGSPLKDSRDDWAEPEADQAVIADRIEGDPPWSPSFKARIA